MIKFFWMISATHVEGPFNTVDEAKDALAIESDPVTIWIGTEQGTVSKSSITIVAEEWEEDTPVSLPFTSTPKIDGNINMTDKGELFITKELSNEETKKISDEIEKECKDDDRPCSICGIYAHEDLLCPHYDGYK